MQGVVRLEDAHDVSLYGSKAVGLGDAARSGVPLPPGVALSGAVVEAVASEDAEAIAAMAELVAPLGSPLAVRSSAVDEDGAEASFAGQHLTLLNVPGGDAVADAVREIWWSANSDSAITYRQRVGLFVRPSVGVVIMRLLDPDSAGVMFTRNPINGADERVIEASWGLGEAVVAGRVVPDNYRIARSGEVLDRTPGYKKLAIRKLPDGGTFEEALAPELVEALCLDDAKLAKMHDLATRCEEVYGADRDIEWAFQGDELFLLQCRAITRVSSDTKPKALPAEGAPAEVVQKVRLFAGLEPDEVAEVRQLFKERVFEKGETVIKEGSGGAAFYVIESGHALVTIGGEPRATLGPGDYFGEIALIDEGVRIATITATTDLMCYGLTLWEFRPLVEQNGVIAWKLLQTLARELRQAEQALSDLRRPAPA
jgi:pyruvate,water dikinase